MVESITDRIRMTDIFNKYSFEPNRAGFIRCPFHNQKTPSCLASGKADMGIAGLRVAPDRKENADFSEPYYNTKQSLLINMDTSDINSLESLKGKSVGVIIGYDGDIQLRDSEGKDVRRYSNGSDIVYDILQGNLDAGIMDTILASGYVNKDVGIRIIDNNLFGEYEEYCIAVRQGNTELLSQINQIISEMRKTNEIWDMALEVDLRME